MKLKYYLRGVGIGVIVATLIMTVSSVIHNNNLSDEYIIKEALKLGMVMPEDTEDSNSLWGSSTEDDTDTSVNTEGETTSETESQVETQTTEDVQIPVDENMVVVTVDDDDAARHVSEKLLAAGLIEDAEDFRSYLANKGYASLIGSGTFQIPKGSTYEEICDIIIRK